MLVVDSREKALRKREVLAAIPSAQIEYLHAGDYLIFDQDGHSIGIERKEISDLLRSLPDRKLERQVASLAQYDRGILLIEGHWQVRRDGGLCVHNKLVGWTPQAVQAMLLAVQERTNAKVLHVADFHETILTLRMLERRGETGCFWPDDMKGDNHGQADTAA